MRTITLLRNRDIEARNFFLLEFSNGHYIREIYLN